METPIAYIPIDRRFALAENRPLPAHTQGAALFADISGFTPLTEMLSRTLGPRRGAEELTVYLNRVYNALITELHQFGGSVIGFSGDAITCWLDGDDGRRGIATAVAMQKAMLPFAQIQSPGGDQLSLSLKTAVVTGPVRRFIVGDPHYLLMDVLAGQTLQHLATAEHQADKGEIMIDEPTAVSLAHQLHITTWRTDPDTQQKFAAITGLRPDAPPVLPTPWPTLPPSALPHDQAQPWLLPTVYRRLQTGQGAFLAELRPAAAFFLRFSGINYDNDPHAPQKLDTFIRRVQQIVTRYEGSLLQLTIGDKGSYLYGVMGAPIAHEDNVDRLLRAAWELQALPDHLPFLEPLQIGITHGRMYAGAYGAVARRTYGVLGDPVNLSARLMQAALPGHILVSQEAFAKASPGFLWHALPAIRVKGKSDPIALHRLIGLKTPQALRSLETLFPHPPVGREKLLDQLAQALAQLTQGQGQVVRMVGEAGMGKSHVTAEFSRRVQAQGFRLCLGVCQSLTHHTLYRPWRDIFTALLDLEEGQETAVIAQLTAFIQNTHPDWSLRLPLLGDLLELPIPDNPTTAALDSETRQKSLFSLLVEMIQTWAQTQPLVLVIDNAHWLDEASEALTRTLAQQAVRTAPVMLLLLHRPELLGGTAPMADIARLPYFLSLVVAELPDADAHTLITQQLGTPPTPLLLSTVQTLTRGNPFFIHELITAMRQGGQITATEGQWQVSDHLLHLLQRADLVTQIQEEWRLKPHTDLSTVKLGLPDSIHGLVLAQLDRLPETHKLTLKVSSVLGYYIDLMLVTEVHPDRKDVTQVEAEAAYMAAEEVVHEEISHRKLYTFRHHTTQEVTYQTLLHSQRQQLHQAVALSLAKQHPEASNEIAHHAFWGEMWPLALRYNLQTGERAKQLHANQQSIDFFQKALHSAQALPASETGEQLRHIHLALGELLVTTGQYEAAHTHLQAALSLSQTQGDREAEARCYRWLGRSHEQRSEFAQALTWLNRGVEILAQAEADGRISAETAELALIAGLINIRQGKYDTAWEFCQRSLLVAQTLPDTAVLARTYNLMGIVDRRRGQSTAAITRFRQALLQYEALQNIYGQATSHNLIANGYSTQGEWPRADHHYRQALEQFSQIGSIYSQVLVNNNLGEIARKQGRLNAAMAYYQRARRLCEQIGGSAWMFGTLHLNIGHTYLRWQAWPEATAQLQLAQTHFQQAQQRDFLPELYDLFAETARQQGDLETAETQAQQALTLAQELKMPREEGHIRRTLGKIALSRQQIATAHQYFQDSYHLLTIAQDEYESAQTQLALADFYTQQGQWAAAEEMVAACQSTFIRLQAQIDQQLAAQVRQTLTDLQNKPA